MPKDRRGGRSLKKQPYSDYDVIGYANNGTIKVLKAKPGIKNAGVPLYSNRTNTVYFIAGGSNNDVTSVGVYRNRKLMFNIDIDPVLGNHYHVWQTKMVRGKEKQVKNTKHLYNLNAAQNKYLQMALNWNSGGN